MDRIHIPTPCHESWEAMEGGEKRRFCNQCSKHVHDLSAMTKAQADKVLEAPNVCVRFREDDAGQVIHAKPLVHRFPRMLALGAALLGASPALAAPAIEQPETQQTIPEAQVDPTWMGWVRQQIVELIGSEETVISQGQVRMGDVGPELVPPPTPPTPPTLPTPPTRMGAVACPPPTPPTPPTPPKPIPLMGKPVMRHDPPVQPVIPAPLPPPAPGQSVIPEVEEALQNQR